MSTKSSIKYGDDFHIYTDMLDDDPAPVHLEVSGVDFTAVASADGSANVTIGMDRALAEQIGLLSDAALTAAKIKTAEAVAAEREACAVIADQRASEADRQIAENNAYILRSGRGASEANELCSHAKWAATGIAAAIRARGSSS